MKKRWVWLVGAGLTIVAAVFLGIKLAERQGPFDFLDGLEPVFEQTQQPNPHEPAMYTYWFTLDHDYESLVREAKAELLPKGWKFEDKGQKCEFTKYFYSSYKTPSGGGSVSTHELIALSNGLRMVKGKELDIIEKPGSIAITIYLYTAPAPESMWQRFLKLLGI